MNFQKLQSIISEHPLLICAIVLIIVLCISIVITSEKQRVQKGKNSVRATHFESLLVCVIIIGICLGLYDFGESINSTVSAFIGALLGWIFKDYIIGIFVFLHLYFRRLLRKGNWIVLPERNIDGKVEEISLLSIVVKNWDNTSTIFPTYLLHDNAFTNWQNIADGKTTGRRILYTFYLDMQSIHTLSAEEQSSVKSLFEAKQMIFDESQEMLNVTQFRKYILSYLGGPNGPASKSANLMVRILESKGEGLPVQIYAYLNEVSNHDFSNAQSKIVEDILAQIPKFGLELFQVPSANATSQVQLVK